MTSKSPESFVELERARGRGPPRRLNPCALARKGLGMRLNVSSLREDKGDMAGAEAEAEAEAQAQAQAQALQKKGEGVCLIRTRDSKGDTYKGTGFHYGNGWVMTAAHNFQDIGPDGEKNHSLINQSEFSFFVGGQPRTFGRHVRMAFIHHLEPGENAHSEDKDIAMVKLGLQYEYGRNPCDYTEWEEEERQNLDGLEIFAKQDDRNVQVGQTVHAVHFGGNNNEKKFEESSIASITGGSSVSLCCRICHCFTCTRNVPLLHLHNPGGTRFPPGSSGCPVLIESGSDFFLVGLHFSGTASKAQALPWSQVIYQYIDNGVGLIGKAEGYLAKKRTAESLTGELQERVNESANELRDELIEAAQENQLTFYLCNGEQSHKQTICSCC